MMQLHRANMFKPAAGGGGGGVAASVVSEASSNQKTKTPSLTLPSGAGNLFIVAHVWNDSGSPVSITSLNWLEIAKSTDGSNEASVLIGYCDASLAGASVAFSMNSDRESSTIAVKIADWDGVTAPVADFHDTNSSKITSPNPPSLAFGWTGDTLCFSGLGFRDEETVTATPSGFSYLADNANGGRAWNYMTSGTHTGGSPVDPGAFTCSTAREAVAYTIAIPGTNA